MLILNERAPDQIIRDDEHVVVKLNTLESLISLKWRGYAPSPVYRSILEDALSNVKLHDLQFWLADLREMAAILRMDETWTVNDWFPRIATSGLRRMAILMSDDFFNVTSVDRIMDGAAPKIAFEVRYFRTPEEALEWFAMD